MKQAFTGADVIVIPAGIPRKSFILIHKLAEGTTIILTALVAKASPA